MHTPQILRASSQPATPNEQDSAFMEFLEGLDKHLVRPRVKAPLGQTLADLDGADPCVAYARIATTWHDIINTARIQTGF